MVVNELLNLGLSQKEAEVYLANLQLGLATAQKIAEKAEINRTTAYATIKNLITRGLINTVDKAGKQYFVAEKPDKLKFFYEQQERELQRRKETIDKIMPELESLYSIATSQKSFRVYKNEETDTFRKEVLARKFHECFEIMNMEVTTFDFQHEYAKKLNDSIDSYKMILLTSSYNSAKEKINEVLNKFPWVKQRTQFRILSYNKFKFPCGFWVADDIFFQISHKDEFIIINDRLFIQAFNIISKFLWEIAEDVN